MAKSKVRMLQARVPAATARRLRQYLAGVEGETIQSFIAAAVVRELDAKQGKDTSHAV